MRVKGRKVISIIIPAVFLFLSGYALGNKGFSLDFNRDGSGRVSVVIDRQVPERHRTVKFSLFWDVWGRVSGLYVDEAAIDHEKMVYGAISGMVSSLGDPYTVFLPPKDNQSSKDDLGGAFEGVGIQLGFDDTNQLLVVTPLTGSPAERADVK